MLLLATQLRAIVQAAWLAWAVDTGVGGRALVRALHPMTIPFAVLILSAGIIWAGSGVRREIGRAFDLACVAVLPIVFVELVAGLADHLFGIEVPGLAASALAYGWTGALIALALSVVRRRAVAPGPARAWIAGAAFLALAGVGAVADAIWIGRHAAQVRPMSAGEAAPDFALPAIGPDGALGPRVTLASVHGKITIIDFWATWCNPCLKALPHLDELQRRHPEIAVLAIALDQPAEARALFDKKHYGLTLLLDDGAASDRYGVTTVPHTIVLDGDGHVRAVGRGGGLDLEAEIAKLRE